MTGRKKSPRAEKHLPVTIAVKRAELEFIDACAKELRISRSQFITNLVRMGMDDVRILKKVGFIKAVGKVRGWMDSQQEQQELPGMA